MTFDRQEYIREYQKNWIADRREKFKQELGPCMVCGTEDDIQIHHLKPTEEPSHRIWSLNEDRIRKELEKCVPLCRKCHRKLHDRLRRYAKSHGPLAQLGRASDS